MRKQRLFERKRNRRRRRGAVAILVAVCLTVILGFAALAIDVGHIYDVQTELQRTADAAALAAVAELGGGRSEGVAMDSARQVASDYAAINEVMNAPVLLANADVVFGRAYMPSGTSKYVFEASEEDPNAVRVRARRTADSPSGAVPLFFARVLGIATTDVAAQATATLIPRDIVFVLDLSGSHHYDSGLRSVKKIDIGNREVWTYLKDQDLDPVPDPNGPMFGNMNTWGDNVTGPSWDCTTDPGLVKLQKGSNWTLTSDFASQTLTAAGYGAYNTAEMAVINSSSGDSSTTAYKRRVRLALGLDRWRSGKSGGQSGGDGDNVIDSDEVVSMVPYPSASSNPATLCKEVGGSWDAYISYVISSSSTMNTYNPGSDLYGDPNLRYRFGLKTWIDYLQEQELGDAASPGLAGAPTQPMGAVADAVKECITIIQSLDSDDKAGMASYGTVGYGPVQKPNHMSWLVDDLESIRAKVNKLQPAMWSNYTNISQGIDKGVEVLFDSPDARDNAAKIMLLLTDGNANYTRSPANYNLDLAPLDAKAAAQDARDRGVKIYTISVGSGADTALMQEIAAIGGGETFHAEGSIETYQEQLMTIFQKLGGKQPIALIQ